MPATSAFDKLYSFAKLHALGNLLFLDICGKLLLNLCGGGGVISHTKLDRFFIVNYFPDILYMVYPTNLIQNLIKGLAPRAICIKLFCKIHPKIAETFKILTKVTAALALISNHTVKSFIA